MQTALIRFLLQIRAEMYSDNDQLRLQLAARNADVNSLLDRAVQYERQSRVAQDELETVRLQMHAAATTRSELDTLPEVPMRFDHIPGQLGAKHHPAELVCPAFFGQLTHTNLHTSDRGASVKCNGKCE